jgi:DHA2 family multidrug resistance protein
MRTFGRRRRAVLGFTAGLIAGVDFLAISTVNFADSSISQGLGVPADAFLWVLTAYAAAGALMILLVERLTRVLRFRTLLLIGLGLFVLGSVAAGLSQSLPQLIAARVLQGLGGGPLMTCARVLLQVSVPVDGRRKQLQGFMLGIFIAAAPGPWLAAWLMQQGDWRALFWLLALVGTVVFGLAFLMIPKGGHVSRPIGHVDLWSALALTLGTLLWLHTLQDLRYQRPDIGLIVRIGLAASLFGLLLWRLKRHPDPWFDLNKLASRRYLTGLLFYTLYYLINGALSLLLPLYLLTAEGLGLETSGRLLSMGGLCTVLALPVYFRLARYLPDRRAVIFVGFALMAALLWLLGGAATGETPADSLLPLIALKGLFPVLVVIQVAGLTFREFKHLDFSHAYALKNTLRLLANAVGAGVSQLAWQGAAARGRVVLVAQVDVYHPVETPFPVGDERGWAYLSELIDRQAALLAGTQTFNMIAAACLLFGVLVLMQKALR